MRRILTILTLSQLTVKQSPKCCSSSIVVVSFRQLAAVIGETTVTLHPVSQFFRSIKGLYYGSLRCAAKGQVTSRRSHLLPRDKIGFMMSWTFKYPTPVQIRSQQWPNLSFCFLGQARNETKLTIDECRHANLPHASVVKVLHFYHHSIFYGVVCFLLAVQIVQTFACR